MPKGVKADRRRVNSTRLSRPRLPPTGYLGLYMSHRARATAAQHSSAACHFRGLTSCQNGASEACRRRASCSSGLSRSPACSSSVSARCQSAHRARAPPPGSRRVGPSPPRLPTHPHPDADPWLGLGLGLGFGFGFGFGFGLGIGLGTRGRYGMPASAPPLLPPCGPRARSAAWPATGGILGLGPG